MAKFIELKTTENQKVYLNSDLIAACEEAPASARVEGHVKVYAGGYKWLIQDSLEELLAKVEKAGENS